MKNKYFTKQIMCLTIFTLLLTNVFAQSENEGYTITVNMNEEGVQKDTLIYLRIVKEGRPVLDSAKLEGGKFIFKGHVPEPQMISVINQNKTNGLSFFLENAPLSVTISNTGVVIQAGPVQKQFGLYQSMIADLSQREDSLTNIYQKAKLAHDSTTLNAVNTQINEVKMKVAQRSKTFVVENPKSFVSLFLLKGLDGVTPLEKEKIFYGLDESIRITPTGKELEESIQLIARHQVGKPAINFTLNDVKNKPIDLESFRGKYVLIEFWASWCGPCRKDNPKLVDIYNKYKNKNFTIIGVSQDKDQEQWKKAIEDDHLEWPQVRDLNEKGTQVSVSYGVQFLPWKILISPEGVIINKFIWVTDEMLARFDELFGGEPGKIPG